MSSPDTDIEHLRHELLEAYDTLRAIHDGEVDAFVLRTNGAYHVAALTEADTPYRLLVESIRDGALTVSREGTVLYCNRPFAERVETSAESVIGQSAGTWLSVESGLDDLLAAAVRCEVRRKGALHTAEGIVPVAVTACALPRNEGRPVFCLLLSDLRDRLEVEELRAQHALLAVQRAELDAICSRLPFAVLLADGPGSFTFLNPAARTLLERHPGLERTAQQAASRVFAGQEVRGEETTLDRAADTESNFRVYARPLSLEAITRALIVVEEVTAARRAQHERERQDEFRETFVGILGHDLRTPLMAITTAAALLKSGVPLERVTQTAQRIENAAMRMKRLIDDMLDMTLGRIGGGIPLVPSHLDLRDVVRPSIDELSRPSAHIELRAEGDCTGEWDGPRLGQVVTNLLSNALQYGAPGSPVRIHIDGSSREHVRLVVMNEGAPIPPELIRNIFDPFRRATRDPARRGRGVGLGLYIAERIVAAHGGSIRVRSTAEEGTAFSVELPRHTAQGAHAS